MASTILADNGVSSGSAGIKTSADSTGVLALQTTTSGGAATTAVTIGTDQSVTFAGNITLNNGAADGAQFSLSSSGYSDWNIDNYSGNFRWYYNATEYMRLNNSGNLGLGVTPSAWGSSWKSLDMAYATTLATNDSGTAAFGSNWRNDGANYIYKSGGYAGMYLSSSATSSVHRWYTAPSGSTGGTISFTQAMTLDASGNLLLGATSTSMSSLYKTIDVGWSGNSIIGWGPSDISVASGMYYNGGWKYSATNSFGASHYEQYYGEHYWATAAGTSHSAGDAVSGLTTRMKLDSSGNLLVGTTSTSVTNGGFILYPSAGEMYWDIGHKTGTTSGAYFGAFRHNGTIIGGITQNGTTGVTYATSSDYRLKENIAPMTGALEKVAQLKPCTYTWKADGADGQGFIAHELQAVVPDAVVGAKDAVDADGNPKYQGIDTSFLVATLTAAIQEQQAIITQLQADVAALKGQA